MIFRGAGYTHGVLPAIVIAFVSVVIAWAFGGPIAAAIVAFLTISALLIDAVLCLLLLHTRLRASRAKTSAVGVAFYVLSVVVMLAAVNFWGPSQIV